MISILKKKLILVRILVVLSTILLVAQLPNHVSSEIPISYCVSNSNPIEIFQDGDFISKGFAGSGTSVDPFIIEDLIILTDADYAIRIEHTTKHFVIQNCTLEAARAAINVEYATSGTVSVLNNTCKNSLFGIKLENCNETTVVNNILIENHTGFSWGYNSLIENNTFINNKEGLYPGSSSIIRNNKFYNDGLNGHHETIYALEHIVENNWVNDKPLGYLYNLEDVDIDIQYGQLFLYNCTNISISNQNFSNTLDGLSVSSCRNVTINNNVLSNNKNMGLFVCDTSHSNITSNFISYNNYNGIHIARSDNLNAENNTCFRNTRNGMQAYIVENCTFVSNLFQSNGDYGIWIDWDGFTVSSKNIIHHNAFFTNNPEGSKQARDECTNTWYDSEKLEGNFWSDLGENSEYLLDGQPVKDLYPLAESPIKPLPEEVEKTNYLSMLALVTLYTIIVVIVRRRRRKRRISP